MEDDLTLKVDTELQTLQNTLKDRLKETQNLSDLNEQILDSSLQLEEKTHSLHVTAKKTKWKWLMKYAKYLIIALGIFICIILITLKILTG